MWSYQRIPIHDLELSFVIHKKIIYDLFPVSKSQLKCLRGKFTSSVTDDEKTRVVQLIKASCLTACANGSASEELDNVKENQKSQNRNVLCCIVEVKQYYCLSYRMWKGVISFVVPVMIYLQDSRSILSSLNKGPYSVCLSLHCHSPPQQPPKLQYNPPPPPMVESQ